MQLVPLDGWRVVAAPDALDTATFDGASGVVRIAADDVFAIGGSAPVVDGDQHAIVTPEHGFAGATLRAEDVHHLATTHIEWELPHHRPALAQGQIAGVPAKLVLHADGSALLLVACAAAHELASRVGGG